MSKDVRFNIKLSIDGKESLVSASTNVKELADGLGLIKTKADTARTKMLSLTQVTTAFQSISASMGELMSIMQTYTNAFNVQAEAETKLETVMRQRMNATDSLIQSVKDLASEQQALGVIGDEVQLMGVQQMATFLTEKASIDTLLPAMNNLLAQQKGLNATGQDAVQIGNLIGKVMQGNVGALTRVGITFTDAQKKMLKYGTEAERAATLAQVITDNVGNMNAALAATDAGKAKQLSNEFGDWQERVGAVFTKMQTATGVVRDLLVTVNAMAAAGTSIETLTKAVVAFDLRAKAAALSTAALSMAQRAGAAATALWAAQVRFANRMQIAWTFGAKAFVVQAVAMRVALVALTTVGIGAAIAGVAFLIEKLTSATGEASEELNKFKDIEEEGRRKSAEVQVELDNETKKLKALIVAKKDTATAVSDLNTKYGDIFGKHKTAAEWYDTLTKKSKAYAMQLGYEAQMKLLATQIAEKQIALEENNQKRAELWRQGKAQKTVKSGGQVSMDGSVHGGVAKTVDTDAYTNLKNTGRGLVADINMLNGKLKIAETRAHDLAKQVGTAAGGTTKTTASVTKPEPAKGKSTTENEIERLKKLKAAAGEAWKSYEALVEGFKDGGEVQAQSKTPEPPKTPKNLAEYDEAIRFYSERQQTEDADQIMATQEKIDELLKGRNVLQLSIDLPDMMKEAAGIDSLRGEDYMIKIGEIGADALIEKLSEINDLLADSENPVGNKQRQSLKMLQKQYGKYIDDLDEAAKKKKSLEQTGKAAESINQMGSALAGLGDALELPVLNIAGTLAQAIATMVQGYATATTQAASMGPWAWIAFAATGLAQLTAMITSVKQATAFANGGIVSGPTYALVGEYAGASNNPEVIAPLDKLRTMLQPSDQVKTIRVVGKIKGRDIVLAQEKEYTHKSRS